MFTILPESRARRSRHIGGSIASAAVHAALIAAALTVATRTPPAGAHDAPVKPPVFVTPRVLPSPPARTTPPRPAGSGAPTTPATPSHVYVDVVPPDLPPIVAGTPTPAEDFRVSRGGLTGISTSGSQPGNAGIGAPDGVIGEHEADRAPHVMGAAISPRYPEALRTAGITGHVLAQFVVDTLGRAEPASVEVLEATRPEFADAVRVALARFRFSPGEAGGRRVRTRVQLPFEFTLR